MEIESSKRFGHEGQVLRCRCALKGGVGVARSVMGFWGVGILEREPKARRASSHWDVGKFYETT